MKIYLAARFSRREELLAYRADLIHLGHEVTSRWLVEDHKLTDAELETPGAEQKRIQWALEDLEDVRAAECVISFTEVPRSERSRGGRHVEFGVGLEGKARMVVVGPRENIFHCLPIVRVFSTWPDLLARITPR